MLGSQTADVPELFPEDRTWEDLKTWLMKELPSEVKRAVLRANKEELDDVYKEVKRRGKRAQESVKVINTSTGTNKVYVVQN